MAHMYEQVYIADLDQTQQQVATDLGLQCLLTDFE